ncbi:aldose epimerase family protein [Sphingobacterium sp. Mn56C]|uniref:aldose epimerase family protein n=1 Tax=Sphingobacterium sp. Mn56C TaxID=3395261 RepID=UPI003BCAADA2
MHTPKIGTLALLLLLGASCQPPAQKNHAGASSTTNSTTAKLVDSSSFAALIDQKKVSLYTLKNDQGMSVQLSNFGARIVGLIVPDRNQNPTDVVLGFPKAEMYNNPEEPFFGTIVGPYGNRIAQGKLTIGNNSYDLVKNDGPNTLHGGAKGVHFAVWDAKQENNSVQFTYLLPDKNEGFPGNIKLTVTYTLLPNNSLRIDYQAISDKETALNLTNHAYFNLNGEGAGTIENHTLQLFADHYTPVDSTLIPTGILESVAGTAFDFRQPKAIGKSIQDNTIQLQYGKGYDHNFVLNKTQVDGYNYAARVVADQTGIVMDIYSKEPGIQFYSGNFMNEKVTLKNGKKDSFRTAFCLEPQNFPDAPNHKNFPNSIYKANQLYSSTSIYHFSVE